MQVTARADAPERDRVSAGPFHFQEWVAGLLFL